MRRSIVLSLPSQVVFPARAKMFGRDKRTMLYSNGSQKGLINSIPPWIQTYTELDGVKSIF